jgi:hypothetical protein
VLGFFAAHLVEDLRGVRISVAEAVGVIDIDASVFFFQRNRERLNLALGQVAEFLAMGRG